LFLTGILVFLGGHVLYATALISRCNSLLPCILAGTLFTALVLAWLFSKITVNLTFKIFSIFHIGALSFLVSDTVLILNTFGPRQQHKLRIVNLSLYYIGQLLIA